MSRWFRAERLGPIIAGLAGLGWFFAELSPQGYGFADTDDPSVGLGFVAAHPTAWALTGDLFMLMSLALIVTVIATRNRLTAGSGPGVARSDVALDAVTVVGLLSAAFLFGHGVVRQAGGPMLYVESLDVAWGEAAYLVTQFAGIHLFAGGGITLLSIWIVGAAWLGVRRGAIPAPVAMLALLPGMRLLSLLGPWSLMPEGLWIFFFASIPAASLWLVLLGVSSVDTLASRMARATRAPEPAEATAI